MNSPDSFEQKLQRQKPRELPPGWRDDVLRTAQEVAIEHARRTAGRRQPTSPATWRRVLTNLFWPHPLAWGGLAAAWLIILVLNIASSDPAEHRMAREASPPSPELRELLREQQQMFAELIGPADRPVATEPKRRSSQPRSAARPEFFNA